MIHDIYNIIAIMIMAIPGCFILTTVGYCCFIFGEYNVNEKSTIPKFLMLLLCRLFVLVFALLLIYTNMFNYSDNNQQNSYIFNYHVFMVPLLWSTIIIIDSVITNKEFYIIYKIIDKTFNSGYTQKIYLVESLKSLKPLVIRINNLKYIIYLSLFITILLEFLVSNYFTPLEFLFGCYIYINYKIYNYVNNKI